MLIRLLTAPLVLALATACAHTPPRASPPLVAHARAAAGDAAGDAAGAAARAAVRATLDSFIVDFNALDVARFDARWAPSASAILPFPDTPDRIEGRDAVLARFHAYFAQVRRERSGPPFLFMVLRDVHIDLVADHVALVAYAFNAGARQQRRSLVLVQGADGAWRITHMHGSSASPP